MAISTFQMSSLKGEGATVPFARACGRPRTCSLWRFLPLRAFSESALERPWYRDNDTAERNEAARRGYEAVLIVTLRHPDSPEYDQFARRVRLRAIDEYGHDVYGEEVCILLYWSIIVCSRRKKLTKTNSRKCVNSYSSLDGHFIFHSSSIFPPTGLTAQSARTLAAFCFSRARRC